MHRAANEYGEALNGDLEPRLIEVLAHLGLAKVFDRTGQAERAANERDQAGRAGQLAPAPAARPQRPLSPVVLTPRSPIQQTEPEYSDEARAAGLEGTVHVSLNIAPDGTSINEKVLSPLGLGLDEKAIECVRQWRFPLPAIVTLEPVTVAVNFLLPAKLSRWHLVSASFDLPDGATRPVFHVVPYPLGAGVSNKAIDEGWVISAIPRAANVRLQFEVNERGVPAKFQVIETSADLWGNEAIAVVRRWRFTPGSKDGKSVAVPCTVDLIWGQKTWTPEILAKVHESMLAAAPEPKPATPPAVIKPPTVISGALIQGDSPNNPNSVAVRVIVGTDGIPTDLHVLRSLGPELDSRVLEAARQWRFNPAIVNGTPASYPLTIELDFAGAR